MTHDELIPFYELLHEKTRYGDTERDKNDRPAYIHNWIRDHISPPATVLDASCGRGHLLKLLKASGYTVTGTEASAWLIDNVLQEFDVRCLRYSELYEIEYEYDVVVSADVLEHMLTVAEVHAALEDLARLSKKYLCITANPNPHRKGYGRQEYDLHHVIKPYEWWEEVVGQYCRIMDKKILGKQSIALCGEVYQ